MSNEDDVNIEVNGDEKSNEDAKKDESIDADANENEKYVQFALFLSISMCL